MRNNINMKRWRWRGVVHSSRHLRCRLRSAARVAQLARSQSSCGLQRMRTALSKGSPQLQLARCSCLTAAVSRACLAISSAACPTRRRQIDTKMPMWAPACTAATDSVEREGAARRGSAAACNATYCNRRCRARRHCCNRRCRARGLRATRWPGRREAPQGAARRRKAPGWALQQPP